MPKKPVKKKPKPKPAGETTTVVEPPSQPANTGATLEPLVTIDPKKQ